MVALAGCQKSSSGEASPGQETASIQAKAPLSETVARLHWLGKKRLEGETNAAFFMSVWNLPESTKLEAQTLDKLAVAFAGFISGATNPALATNSSVVGLVRPLLDDLLKEECYFEVRSATNQPGEIALAIRLNEDRADVWKSNFPKLFAQLAGVTSPNSAASPRSWQAEFETQNHKIKNRIAMNRAETWTLITLSRWSISGEPPSSAGLLKELAGRIQNGGAPFAAVATNFWLEADVDLPRLASGLACGWELPASLPKFSISMIGDGLNVRTRGELAYSEPLKLEIEPWNIPTNLVHDPLVSFTAVNSVRPLLSAIPGWSRLNIQGSPNQLYCWGIEGAAVETYFAAPIENASNSVYALSGYLMQACNPSLTNYNMGELRRAKDFNGLSWSGFPFVAPFLRSVGSKEPGFVFGGLGPEPNSTNTMPTELIHQVYSRTNLVYYDWEITGPRILAGIYTTQLGRVMFRKAQLPERSLSMTWLKALSSKLGNCGTEITANGATGLSFVRKSSVGLTAMELHLLADWLESPRFPESIHTLAAPEPMPRRQRPENAELAH